MVSVRHNKSWWEGHDWNELGEEWSRPWGGVDAQWFGTLLPRVHHFLPAADILEIACGYGRWTHYLKDHCDRYTGVDLASNCVAACQERFTDQPHMRFINNDGLTLRDVPDASIDFAFSFDSLVHVDKATIASYLTELRRVLRPDGVAFIHHSNLGEYSPRYVRLAHHPKLGRTLLRARLVEFQHVRDPGVSAKFVARKAKQAGLRCIGQEIIPWIERRTFIDCVSVIVPAESPGARPNVIVRNQDFRDEPAYAERLASVYGPQSVVPS